MPPQGSIPSVPKTEQVEKISCWICGKKFKKQVHLQKHISYKHSIPCQSCGTIIFGDTCRIHQRSTEESKVQFVEKSNEGSENELVGTGTEEPEIQFIGVVSCEKAFEKFFPMGDEEFQENQHAHPNEHHDSLAHAAPTDDLTGLAHSTHAAPAYDHIAQAASAYNHIAQAAPANNHIRHAPTNTHVGLDDLNAPHNNHVGNAHTYNHISHDPTNNHVGLAHATHSNSGPNGGYPIHNGFYPIHNGGHAVHVGGQPMHHGGYPIHDGATPIHNGFYPIHNGGHSMHIGGQPMPTRAQLQMVNWHPSHNLQQQLPRDQNQMQNQHGPNNYLGQNRTFVLMNNHRQTAAPTQNNRIKKSRGSFEGKLKVVNGQCFRR